MTNSFIIPCLRRNRRGEPVCDGELVRVNYRQIKETWKCGKCQHTFELTHGDIEELKTPVKR